MIEEPTRYLLSLLDKYSIKAIFYILDCDRQENSNLYDSIVEAGHTIGSHGKYHYHDEYSDSPLFRSPYWDTTPMPFPPAGGFFFRFMPFWYVKWATKKSGVFWIHPHDLLKWHPTTSSLLLNMKRQLGLNGSRKKLERLLREVSFGRA